jgi:asparagine synthase (glutamine-hydrolysing)
MCGIFGIFSFSPPINLLEFEAATSVLRHRGPDDEGYLLYNLGSNQAISCGGSDSDPRLDLPDIKAFHHQSFNLALGFRRLAILDLTPSGHQPMSSQDGRYWIVFNGEIYNYLELRAELQKMGFSFHSTSDTEVLLAAYACWGEAMLQRLVGMFAFCILDTQAKRLFLARDFFGIKPLYYVIASGYFAFASEIKPLLDMPGALKIASAQSVYTYLRYGISDFSQKTFFRDIFQLAPAHCFSLDLNNPKNIVTRQYWCLNLEKKHSLSLDEAAQELKRLFLENVRFHLRSDVPIGACLSGGIDSSAVVMGIRQETGPNLDFHTFSYVSKEPTIFEENWMDLVSSRARTIVHKVSFSPQDLVNDLDRLINIQEEPFGSTSIYAQFRVFQLVKQNSIKVMEDGQGADELLGGYLPYTSARIASLASKLAIGNAIQLFRSAKSLGLSQGLLLRRSTGFLIPKAARRFARRFSGGRAFLPWVNQSWFNTHGALEIDPFEKNGTDYLRQDLYLALTRTSLPMLLRYEDRNSMAFSIESRVPFLTPSFAEFVFSLPEEYLIDGNANTKAVFRKAMNGLVPNAILARRDKIGFATPEKQLLSSLSPWVDQVLRSDLARNVQCIEISKAIEEWQRILEGKKEFNFSIWRILNLIKWAGAFEVSFV